MGRTRKTSTRKGVSGRHFVKCTECNHCVSLQHFETHWSDTTNPHEIDDRPAHKRYYLLKNEKKKWNAQTNPIIETYPDETPTPPSTDSSEEDEESQESQSESQSEETQSEESNDNEHDQNGADHSICSSMVLESSIIECV